jgi:hypothetical protein
MLNYHSSGAGNISNRSAAATIPAVKDKKLLGSFHTKRGRVEFANLLTILSFLILKFAS